MAKKKKKIPTENEACVRCGYMRQSHELGNYADGPMIGRSFLVCPTATWKSARPEPKTDQ